MRRAALAAVAAVTAGSIGLACCGPAAAANTGNSLAYAAAAQVLPGSGATPTLTTGGTVGALVGSVTPVLNQVFTPLATALSGLSAQIVGDLTTVSGAGGSATGSSAIATPHPTGGSFPSCTSTGWIYGNCYGPANPSVSDGSVLSLTNGSMQGYATTDSTGSYASARAANFQLAVLGNPIGSLGVSNAGSVCTTALICSASTTLTGMSLLGGQLAIQTAPDGSLQVSMANSAWLSASSLVAPVNLSVPGLASATVQANGTALTVRVGMTLHNLLVALGIPDTLQSLGAVDQGSTVLLTLGIGTGNATNSTSGTAQGLTLTLGLGVNANVLVAGLASVGLAYADTPGGNLAGLQLAYTSTADPDPSNPAPIGTELK